jgi:hypothetical protein
VAPGALRELRPPRVDARVARVARLRPRSTGGGGRCARRWRSPERAGARGGNRDAACRRRRPRPHQRSIRSADTGRRSCRLNRSS